MLSAAHKLTYDSPMNSVVLIDEIISKPISGLDLYIVSLVKLSKVSSLARTCILL